MFQFLSMVDILFEGMMENDEEMDSHDEIVNVSVIAERLWLTNGEVKALGLVYPYLAIFWMLLFMECEEILEDCYSHLSWRASVVYLR